MEAKQVVERIERDIHDIHKIRIHNDAMNRRHLTWRIAGGRIYAYDCGNNYACMGLVPNYEELLRDVSNSISDKTKEIIIKYTDGSKEVIL
jgi:hypothetical protein